MYFIFSYLFINKSLVDLWKNFGEVVSSVYSLITAKNFINSQLTFEWIKSNLIARRHSCPSKFTYAGSRQQGMCTIIALYAMSVANWSACIRRYTYVQYIFYTLQNRILLCSFWKAYTYITYKAPTLLLLQRCKRYNLSLCMPLALYFWGKLQLITRYVYT